MQQLKQFPSLMEQLQLHTVSGAYVWQYFKDPAQLNLPPLPLQTAPHRLDTTEGAPADTSDVLPVPAPVPVGELAQEVLSQEQECEVGKLYASFLALYKYAPDYGHAPSAVTRVTKRGKGNLSVDFSSKNVRGIIQCQDCGKARAFYSLTAWRKLRMPGSEGSDDAHTEIERACADDPQFVCGAEMFPSMHSLHHSVFTRQDLECSSPLEVALYKLPHSTQSRVNFDTTLCGNCGLESVLIEDEDEDEEEERVTQFLPQCQSCKDVRAPQVVLKKATKKQAKKRVKKMKKAASRASTSIPKPVDSQSKEDTATEGDCTEDDSVEKSQIEVSSDENDDCIAIDSSCTVQPPRKCARTLRRRNDAK
jgi:hypothetical protein